MKNKSSIKVLILSSLFATALAVGSSLSWFAPTASIGNNRNPITGEVEDEYYASGTGDAGDPYVITKPRHLYNLAWLQYLGFYNKSAGIDNHQFYFVLGNNIDMSEFGPIPPIGSELNPFVGNFDGQGYVVSNVTISNKFSDYNSHPSAISGWDNSTKKQPHILGFFGIIGEYTNGNKPTNYDTAKNEFINTGLTGVNIVSEVTDCLVGVAAGCSLDSDLTDAHKAMKNIVVDNSKITLPNSATSAYDSTNLSANISDYTLVGYTNDVAGVIKGSKSLYGINVDTNISFNATETGTTEGWGGSIDMKSMYERLYNIGTNSVSNYTYTYRTVNTTNPAGGNITGSPSTSTVTAKRYHPNNNVGNFLYLGDQGNYMYLSGGQRVVNNKSSYVSHSGYYIKVGTNYLSYNPTNGIYNVSNDESTATIWTFEEYSTGVYYIYTKYADSQTTTTSPTTYYLYSNSGSLGITTSKQSTGRWTVSSLNSNQNMSIVYSNKKVYYYNGSWTLIPTTDGAETFDVIQYTSGTNTYYISSSSTSGNAPTRTTANDLNSAARMLVDGNNYVYFNNGSTNLYLAIYRTGGYNSTTALRFINATGQTNYYYFTYSGGTLRASRSSQYGGTTYYYVSYSDNSWTYSTSNTSIGLTSKTGSTVSYSTMNLDYTIGSTTSRNGPDYYFDSNNKESKMEYSDQDTTYFPLNVVKDGGTTASYVTNGNYAPTDANTGYVVAGSRVNEDTTITNGGPSAIRVSKYSKTYTTTENYQTVQRNISNSFKYSNNNYANGTISDSDVRTITGSGDVALSTVVNSLERYTDSKETLLSVLRSDSYNYGLHFMNAEISMGNLVDASNVSILGTNYTTKKYQLPVNSIDFNLKEKGFINFFAGTYFSSDVDTFFSLHQVLRGDDTGSVVEIEDIKEISAIYGNTSKKNYSYIYQYKGDTATYSKPYRFDGTGKKYELSADDTGTTPYVADYELSSISTYTSNYGYTKLFDTDWITNYNSSGNRIRALNQSYLYYFEIPMNAGEYCLGSVAGASGGYLLYLDIGANAAKTNRTILYERFSYSQKTYSYPVGVSLGSLPSTFTSGTPTIDVTAVVDASDSACMVIKTSAYGVFEIDRNGDDVALSRAQAANAPPVYAGETITKVHEKNSDTALEPAYISAVSYEARRMQYYDYNINTDTLTVTTFTDFSTDGGNTFTTREIEQSKYAGNNISGEALSTYVYNSTTDERSSMKIYNSTNGVRYSNADIISQSIVPITSSKISNTLVLEIKLLQDGGDSYDDVTSVILAIDTSISETETFYKYDGFSIVLTPTSGSITVKVIGYTGSFTITIYNYATSTPTTSTSTVTTEVTVNGTEITGTIGQTITIPAP